jgi:hypothetical protein
LKVDIPHPDPTDQPYYYKLPGNSSNGETAHDDFVNAAVVEVCMEDRFGSSAFFSIPGPIVLGPSGTTHEHAPGSDIWTAKVVKYGRLGRKDDIVEGGKRAINRKWKEWGVILTGSQLLLYRDPPWMLSLLARLPAQNDAPLAHRVTLTRPDEFFPLRNSIAVHDMSYLKVCVASK